MTQLKRQRPYSYDERCEDLANVFLRDLAGATAEDSAELAQQIQGQIEDFCNEIERRVAERTQAGNDPAQEQSEVQK